MAKIIYFDSIKINHRVKGITRIHFHVFNEAIVSRISSVVLKIMIHGWSVCHC